MHVDLNSDLNSDPMSNFNTDGRTDGTKNITRSDSANPCNARARDDENDEVGETEARLMARLLEERNSRTSGERAGANIAQILDKWFARMERDYGKRWPVIRSGEREPIPWPLRASILDRDQRTCKVCKIYDVDFELDHCVPWSAGGPDDSDNLRTLCVLCNQKRSNFIDEAHMTSLCPTTYWCVDCWTYEAQQTHGRWWKDATDLTGAPLVGEGGQPWELVWCAHCHYYSTSDIYFVGAAGRALLERATRFVRAVPDERA